MELSDLKKKVFDANLELVERGLVIYTWGNVSGIDRENGLVVIKPRGIEYDQLEWQDMSVTKLDGTVVDGRLLPSVDLDYHTAMYRAFPQIGGIAHTHSVFATCFAQAMRPIPVFGTTHADHFYGPVPCLPYMLEEEVAVNYEENAGRQIVRFFSENGIDPMTMRAVLCGGHGPFTWGSDAAEAVEFSVILEEMAKMAYYTILLGGDKCLPGYMLDKHYKRKYGSSSYFYQSK